MDFTFSKEDEIFREEIRTWLEAQLSGDFKSIRGRGGPGDEHSCYEERREWEAVMARDRWTAVGWPEQYGGRGLSLYQEVIFNEEYARAGGPGRLNHIGETLAGPTVIAFGTEEQKKRFLPGIVSTKELWAQGYSEPNAGSDLANVQTKAVVVDGKWSITGQKVWTSLAHWADWCFVVCRTSDKPRHKGLSYIMVPLRQEGVEIRPIEQISGTAEFNEVFFDGAKSDYDNLIGEVDGGWKVAMATLGFERGASTLGQQLSFENEMQQVIRIARENGADEDPVIRQRIADAYTGLKIMRLNALRLLSNIDSGSLSREAMVSKLYWSNWHRRLGDLAMDVLGLDSDLAEFGEDGKTELTALQRMYLFSRSDTIYAGSNQIQRNIIAERGLGLPR